MENYNGINTMEKSVIVHKFIVILSALMRALQLKHEERTELILDTVLGETAVNTIKLLWLIKEREKRKECSESNKQSPEFYCLVLGQALKTLTPTFPTMQPVTCYHYTLCTKVNVFL